MISFPNAKINLGLDILEKRKDGFHNLSTCFYPIPLTDVLEFVESKKFDFQVSGNDIDGNPDENLVVKAYRLLKRDFQLPELSIHLHKIVPTGAGLGGGSSDAAFMLASLNTYFELFLDDDLLVDYASTLGSDCAFFIYNKAMMASGKGEVLIDINLDLKGKFLCLIKPEFSIPTNKAYQRVMPKVPNTGIERIIANPMKDWKQDLKNDFEEALFPLYPRLSEIKELLYSAGAAYAAMTGSGSAVYGLFEEEPNLPELDSSYFLWVGKL